MTPPRLLQLLSTLVIAWGLGLGATWWSLERGRVFGNVVVGPWTIQPRIGAADIDPYARAALSRTGALPLASGEGVTIVAGSDSAGDVLTARCEYRVEGLTPAARGWTLTTHEAEEAPSNDLRSRATVTSSEALRDQDARLAIAVGRIARAGNWLPLRGEGGFALVLRLYDTPISALNAAVLAQDLPRIERVGCS